MDLFGVILLASLLALVPTLIYAALVWWLDRYEKEPLPLLVVAFLWGAVPAVILALVLEIGAGIPLQTIIQSAQPREFAETSFVGPIVEESVKAVILVVLFFAYKREFDDVLDGIVYGAMVGLGFAMVENVLYLQSAAYNDVPDGAPPDLQAMITLWILRAGLFGLNHSMFTAFTGAALGLARSIKLGRQKGLIPTFGLGTAILFHGTHNVLTSLVGIYGSNSNADGSGLALGSCLGVIAADFFGLILVLALAIISSVREGRVIRDTLWEEVALGRLTPDEYETLTSGRRRWVIRWTVLLSLGIRRWRQVGKFFDLSTELAFRKHRMSDGDPIQQNISAGDVAKLRSAIDSLKMEIIYAR